MRPMASRTSGRSCTASGHQPAFHATGQRTAHHLCLFPQVRPLQFLFGTLLGWLGVAVTGSDTSANALFATLQQTAAKSIGIDPTLLVAANTSGGVVGKMISPQNLAIAATAVGLVGHESVILRKVIWWSLGLLAVLCLLVGLQSTPVLSWMLP